MPAVSSKPNIGDNNERPAGTTFHNSHALDLSLSVVDKTLSVADIVLARIERLRADVSNCLAKIGLQDLSGGRQRQTCLIPNRTAAAKRRRWRAIQASARRQVQLISDRVMTQVAERTDPRRVARLCRNRRATRYDRRENPRDARCRTRTGSPLRP